MQATHARHDGQRSTLSHHTLTRRSRASQAVCGHRLVWHDTHLSAGHDARSGLQRDGIGHLRRGVEPTPTTHSGNQQLARLSAHHGGHLCAPLRQVDGCRPASKCCHAVHPVVCRRLLCAHPPSSNGTLGNNVGFAMSLVNVLGIYCAQDYSHAHRNRGARRHRALVDCLSVHTQGEPWEGAPCPPPIAADLSGTSREWPRRVHWS